MLLSISQEHIRLALQEGISPVAVAVEEQWQVPERNLLRTALVSITPEAVVFNDGITYYPSPEVADWIRTSRGSGYTPPINLIFFCLRHPSTVEVYAGEVKYP